MKQESRKAGAKKRTVVGQYVQTEEVVVDYEHGTARLQPCAPVVVRLTVGTPDLPSFTRKKR